MPRVDKEFAHRVTNLVRQIPAGRVMTYGQLAALAGCSWAAWEVGQIAHYGDPALPWQRVVNKRGGLANGYPGGRTAHGAALAQEGCVLLQKDGEEYVDMNECVWLLLPDGRVPAGVREGQSA